MGSGYAARIHNLLLLYRVCISRRNCLQITSSRLSKLPGSLMKKDIMVSLGFTDQAMGRRPQGAISRIESKITSTTSSGVSCQVFDTSYRGRIALSEILYACDLLDRLNPEPYKNERVQCCQ